MVLIPLLALLVFGLLHSLLAAIGFKQMARQIMGPRLFEGMYRLLYNIFSAIALIPVVLVLAFLPSHPLWRVPMPWAAVLLLVQGIAATALIGATLQADPLRFAGISQALAYLRGDPLPLPPEPLQVGGFYRLVRHPLYMFSLLVIWCIPVMTDIYFGAAIGATLYFLIGSRLEERRLAQEFGTRYLDYRQRVPWLLPWPRPRS